MTRVAPRFAAPWPHRASPARQRYTRLCVPVRLPAKRRTEPQTHWCRGTRLVCVRHLIVCMDGSPRGEAGCTTTHIPALCGNSWFPLAESHLPLIFQHTSGVFRRWFFGARRCFRHARVASPMDVGDLIEEACAFATSGGIPSLCCARARASVEDASAQAPSLRRWRVSAVLTYAPAIPAMPSRYGVSAARRRACAGDGVQYLRVLHGP